jgi:broad specificity phosphatase PhoE
MVRHAQSTWNAEGRWQGHADPPLSPLGEQQAATAATALLLQGPFQLAVTSDLSRVTRTAAVLLGAFPEAPETTTTALLRELDVGEWSGLTRTDIEATWPGYLERFAKGLVGAAPGGEDIAQFDRRVGEAMALVAQMATEAGADRTLVVTHGGVIRSLGRRNARADVTATNLAGWRGVVRGSTLVPTGPIDLLAHAPYDSGHQPSPEAAGAP